jgi:hypothetical protein
MTILSHLQEGGDNYGYTSDSVNPVTTSAEFILKVSTTFSRQAVL